MHYLCPFCNQLEDRERSGCFIVLRMSCYCACSLTLSHGAVGWSAVCDCFFSCSYSLTKNVYCIFVLMFIHLTIVMCNRSIQ